MKNLFIIYCILFACSVANSSTYIKGPALIEGSLSTATSAGTLTLDAASETNQVLTGSTTHTLKLPDATTLVNGRRFHVVDRSTGAILVRNGANSILTSITPNKEGQIILLDNSTQGGVWAYSKTVVDFANDTFSGVLANSFTTATALNTADAIVARDSSGNFVAGTITANVTGAVTGNASTATALAANPTDCSSDTYANAIAASGNLTCASITNASTTATSANTASAIVARDGSGNFTAGTITAALTGAASGNLSATANNHGVLISGSANVATVVAPDASTTKVLTSGGSSADPSWQAIPTSSYEISNLGLATSVGSSALTISLKQADGSTNPAAGTGAVNVGMGSSTLTSGLYNQRQATAATSLVISSGSTLGQTSAKAATIWIYLIDNAGTLELAASGTLFHENQVITTTAEGGAGAADSATVMYSTTQRTSVPFRLIGSLVNTQSTAGTWASAGTTLRVGNSGALARRTVAMYAKSQTPTGTVGASDNIVKFGTVTKETDSGSYDTSTGLFTVPITGWYTATGIVEFSGAFINNQIARLGIKLNGSTVIAYVAVTATATSTANLSPIIAITFYATAGDTVGLYSLCNGTGCAIAASATDSSFSIVKVGD